MKKTNGFTLFELVAIIIILGIIALIAMPTLSKIINESKEKMFKSSVENIIKAVNEQCHVGKADGNKFALEYTFDNQEVDKELDVEGILPDGGKIVSTSNCNINLALYNKDYCAIKGKNDEYVKITKTKKGKCVIEDVKSYQMYDVVKLSDGSLWQVIEDSDELSNYVKIISVYNIDLKNNKQDPTDIGIEGVGYAYKNGIFYKDIDYYLNRYISSLELGEDLAYYGLITVDELAHLMSCPMETQGFYSCFGDYYAGEIYWFKPVLSWGAKYDHEELKVVMTASGSSASYYDFEKLSYEHFITVDMYGLRPVIKVHKDHVTLFTDY